MRATTAVRRVMAGLALWAISAAAADASPPNRRLVILHTNDLHSHLMGFGPEADYSPSSAGDDETVGGAARLAAAIARARGEAGETPALLLDAGDFAMGTAFHLLSTHAAAELMLMKRMGYDAIALGNHEFDWTPSGLAGMLAAAAGQGFDLPLLATNMQFDPVAAGDDELARFEPSLLRRTVVKVLPNGLRVGLFGLMGRNASAVAPMAWPVTFGDPVAAARAAVVELRGQAVDVIVCLSHSGIDSRGDGEDAALAREVPGIDVIVSGHTHDALAHPARVGDTLIVQAGSYGRNLGRLEVQVMTTPGGNRVTAVGYDLIAIDDSHPGDPSVQEHVEGYISVLDAALAPAGLSYRRTLVESEFDVTHGTFAETPIGDLATDAYRAAVARLQPGAPAPIALEFNGLLRADLPAGTRGAFWFADLFRVVPLGIGPDASPGYPLVTLYLAGPDIKGAFEVMAAADLLGGDDFFAQVAGARVEYDPDRPPFHRVVRVAADGADVDLADGSTCYQFTANLYVAGLLGLVEAVTGGAVAIEPKMSDCRTPVTDWPSRIVDADPSTPGIQELKAWHALMGYVSAFPDANANGVPDLPPSYERAGGRIVRLN